MISSIFKGDDTGAFGGSLITLEFENPNGIPISRLDFRCGKIFKQYEKPQSPLKINLTSTETEQLDCINSCYVAFYDNEGRKKTQEAYFSFCARRKVV